MCFYVSVPSILRTFPAVIFTTVPWYSCGIRTTAGLAPPHGLSATIALALLAREMHMTPRCRGYLVSGYPRHMDDVHQYNQKLGNIDGAILLDWRESTLLNKLEAGARVGTLMLDAARKELSDFHSKVLPVCEHYDNLGLLYVVSGDRSQEEVFRDVQRAHARILQPAPLPPPSRASVGSYREYRSMAPFSQLPALSASSINVNANQVSLPPCLFFMGSYREYRSMAPFSQLPALSASSINVNANQVSLPPCLFFMGGPGSDKWKLVSGITYLYPGWACVGVGQMLREHIDRWKETPEIYEDLPSEKVVMIQNLMTKGELVPQDLVLQLLKEKLESLKGREGIVVVGYPKDVIQAQSFEEKFHQIPPLLLVDCSELELGRNLGRRESRLDDNVAAARRRLAIYREVTLPMLKAFDEKNRLKIIDGDADIEQVEREVKRAIYVETQLLSRRSIRNEAEKAKQDQSNGNVLLPPGHELEVEVRSLSHEFSDSDINGQANNNQPKPDLV
ncbi:adenylate kinase isoenzyme 5-like [Penaeus indicus]|uniref:adenylate kinase isoenzyme 5-like n=1 Tax=Penaeus indicus TaxID=29960 RepID=UPI00300D081D